LFPEVGFRAIEEIVRGEEFVRMVSQHACGADHWVVRVRSFGIVRRESAQR
jgi:hypothetical protein